MGPMGPKALQTCASRFGNHEQLHGASRSKQRHPGFFTKNEQKVNYLGGQPTVFWELRVLTHSYIISLHEYGACPWLLRLVACVTACAVAGCAGWV